MKLLLFLLLVSVAQGAPMMTLIPGGGSSSGSAPLSSGSSSGGGIITSITELFNSFIPSGSPLSLTEDSNTSEDEHPLNVHPLANTWVAPFIPEGRSMSPEQSAELMAQVNEILNSTYSNPTGTMIASNADGGNQRSMFDGIGNIANSYFPNSTGSQMNLIAVNPSGGTGASDNSELTFKELAESIAGQELVEVANHELTDAEMEEYGKLLDKSIDKGKESLTPEEKTRLVNLEERYNAISGLEISDVPTNNGYIPKMSAAELEEYSNLANKEKRTPEEEERITYLNKLVEEDLAFGSEFKFDENEDKALADLGVAQPFGIPSLTTQEAMDIKGLSQYDYAQQLAMELANYSLTAREALLKEDLKIGFMERDDAHGTFYEGLIEIKHSDSKKTALATLAHELYHSENSLSAQPYERDYNAPREKFVEDFIKNEASAEMMAVRIYEEYAKNGGMETIELSPHISIHANPWQPLSDSDLLNNIIKDMKDEGTTGFSANYFYDRFGTYKKSADNTESLSNMPKDEPLQSSSASSFFDSVLGIEEAQASNIRSLTDSEKSHLEKTSSEPRGRNLAFELASKSELAKNLLLMQVGEENINIAFTTKNGNNGYSLPGSNKVTLNGNISEETLKGTLIHELYHIQESKNGGGGNNYNLPRDEFIKDYINKEAKADLLAIRVKEDLMRNGESSDVLNIGLDGNFANPSNPLSDDALLNKIIDAHEKEGTLRLSADFRYTSIHGGTN